MEKYKIPLIALAVFSIVILLTQGNIEKVYDISIQSNLNFMAGGTSYSTLYYSKQDVVIVGASGGAVSIVDAGSLTVTDTATATDFSGGANTGGNEGYACSTSTDLCIYPVLADTNMRIGVLDMSDYATSIRTISNTTFNSCRITNLANTNTGVTYATLGACSNGAIDGVWRINFNNIGTAGANEIITTEYPTVGHSGVTMMCHDSVTGKIAMLNTTPNHLYVFTPSLGTAVVVDLTTVNSDAKLHCDDNGYAHVADIDTDNIRIVSMSSSTLVSTTAVTNPNSVVRHGDDVYVSLQGSTTASIYAFSASGAMSQIGTIVGLDNSLYMLKGNSTRINAVGLESSFFDIFAISELQDDGSGVSSPASEACIDTNLDGITDLCFTDTNNDGVADNGQAGALGAFQSNSNVTALGTMWFCAFNIGDACDNEDVQTNGVGVFFTIFLVIVSYALLVSIHIMAQKQLNHNNVVVMDALKINPVLLLFMLILDISLVWYLGFIEDTIFYTVIVVMAGLGGFGIYKMVKGNGGD